MNKTPSPTSTAPTTRKVTSEDIVSRFPTRMELIEFGQKLKLLASIAQEGTDSDTAATTAVVDEEQIVCDVKEVLEDVSLYLHVAKTHAPDYFTVVSFGRKLIHIIKPSLRGSRRVAAITYDRAFNLVHEAANRALADVAKQ